MSSFKTDQKWINHRGRQYHFVSYDGAPANARTGTQATAASWYLVSAGKRWPAIAIVPDQNADELTAAFAEWLDVNLLGLVKVDSPPGA